jgi:predicted RNase H-like HicB family nuclease
MRSYLALVEAGDERHAFGIRFPDLPGVFSAADSKDDIVPNAIEALRLWAEDEALPEPSDPVSVTARSDVKEDLRKGWYLIDVPLIESDPKAVRANVTFERGVLEAIDTTAKTLGMTRSAFLSVAAQSKIERSDRPWRVRAAAAGQFTKKAAAKPAAAKAAKPAAKAAPKPAAAKEPAAAKAAPSRQRIPTRRRKG